VEFEGCIKAYELKEENEWRRLRTLYTLIYNVNSKRQKRAVELIPLPGDNKKVTIASTREQFEFLLLKWK